ncbi:MAG: metallophosphoesterase family protein [Planctomycetaceae bacterium]
MSGSRTFAIGDIHGCPNALQALVRELDIRPDDTVITLGDYVGKGPDSRGVLECLIELKSRCRLIPLLGNHDRIMLAALRQEISGSIWKKFGGDGILESYGRREAVPPEHLAFLNSCLVYHENENFLFAHACCDPDLPLAETPETTLLWQKLDHQVARHVSGKRAIVGHTCQRSGEILVQEHIICIDTNCWAGGWLTAYEVNSQAVVQVNRNGRRRAAKAETT